MADQRLILSYGDRQIVLAKRSGTEWISAQEERNDLGKFLNGLEYGGDRPVVEISYEEDAWYCDPEFIVKPFGKGRTFIEAYPGTCIGFFKYKASRNNRAFTKEETYFIKTVDESGVIEIPEEFCGFTGILRVRRFDAENYSFPFTSHYEFPIKFEKGGIYQY